jgi:hypothetical protein
MMKVLVVFLFAGVGRPAVWAGMGAGDVWLPDADELKSALNLTDQQITRLRDLRRAQFQAMQPRPAVAHQP